MNIKAGTYTIGRSPDANIVLPERATSASRIHAELVVTNDHRLFLVDRNSSNGTWMRMPDGWEALTQSYIEPDDWVIFGDYGVCMSELLSQVAARPAPNPSAPELRPRGRPMRNPETGEIYYV
ncbi:FHA domain-containing protein [Halorhodospira sp. 9622]|uniref:FHA domain-containing protein n=1 Tax=Halorhodospira sp. 9622 TaxID=2899136 RepID=UPI001EE8FD40|nr:FHA domain-containing protein [Halorhodospira sp. 9622]MCG5539351.1 FHA domain-containing protein [Halorhodospira sp. 9622]